MCGSKRRQWQKKTEGRFSQSLARLQFLDAFQKNVPHAGERLGTDDVHVVLRRVPVTVIHKISDDVQRRNTAGEERVMVVLGLGCGVPKKRRIA